MDTRWWILPLALLLLTPVRSRGQDDPTASDQSSPFSQAKFVPDISLILDCDYLLRSLPDESYEELTVPGSDGTHEHGESHRGFNLNYAEINFYSVVDPYFELFAVLHVSEEHFHLEEAYGLTRMLPLGLQVKVGKFLSGFGRIEDGGAGCRRVPSR